MQLRKTKGRDSKEYKEWKIKVHIRDNWTCQECGCENKALLHAHHIKSWQHNIFSRFKVENGITLCVYCHAKKHPHLMDLLKGKVRKKHKKINRKLKFISKNKKFGRL